MSKVLLLSMGGEGGLWGGYSLIYLQDIMTKEEKIIESIKRLDDLKPSQWNPAVVLKIKKYLFPLILDCVAEKTAQPDQLEEAKEIFGT